MSLSCFLLNHGRDSDPGVCLVVNDAFVVFSALHQRPSNRGQVLLVPTARYGGLADVPPEKAHLLLAALQATTQAVKAAFHASGTTVRVNQGPPAKDILHLHWYIIPRHVGDDFNAAKSAEVPLSERLDLTATLARHLGDGTNNDPLAATA